MLITGNRVLILYEGQLTTCWLTHLFELREYGYGECFQQRLRMSEDATSTIQMNGHRSSPIPTDMQLYTSRMPDEYAVICLMSQPTSVRS